MKEEIIPNQATNKNEKDTSIPFHENQQTAKNNNLKDWQDTKRQVQKETMTLEGGKSIATMNGGDLQPIMYKFVNAGERINTWKVKKQCRVLAPKVPTLDALSMTIRAGFIPMNYIVNDYDTLRANKKSIGRTLDTKLPTTVLDATVTIGGVSIPIQKTAYYKRKTPSFYLPNNVANNLPFSVLPTRAYHAFRNAFCRNKQYTPATIEFREPTTTSAEKTALNNPYPTPNAYGTIHKDQPKNNYYTNIKPELQAGTNDGLDRGTNFMHTPDDNNIVNQYNEFLKAPGTANAQGTISQTAHIDWQNQIAEFRRRTNDAIKNDWDIVAELGGTNAVKTDRPQYLGEKTIKLNYQQITQTAPSTANNVSPLGATGAYSVTFDEDVLFGYKEFQQDGIIIITATVTADNTFEEAIHRTALIQSTTEMFNPEIAKQQTDVLLKAEIDGTRTVNTVNPSQNSLGFKPKYTEFDTMPNLCIRDVRTIKLERYDTPNTQISSASQWHNMRSVAGLVSFDAGLIFDDKTDELIARNSLQTTTDFQSEDQILVATEHEVTVHKHKKLAEIKSWGVEN